MWALAGIGEPEGLGLIVRALYEEWLVSALIVDGSDEDRDRLERDHQFNIERLLQRLHLVVPPRPVDVGTPTKWATFSRVQRVEELHRDSTAISLVHPRLRGRIHRQRARGPIHLRSIPQVQSHDQRNRDRIVTADLRRDQPDSRWA